MTQPDTSINIDALFYYTGMSLWIALAIFVAYIIAVMWRDLAKSFWITCQYFHRTKGFRIDRHILSRIWHFIRTTWQGATGVRMEISWTNDDGNRESIQWNRK